MTIGKGCLAAFLFLMGLWLAGVWAYGHAHGTHERIVLANRSGRNLSVFHRDASGPKTFYAPAVELGPYETGFVGLTTSPRNVRISVEDARNGVLLKTFVSTDDSVRGSNGDYVYTYKE